MITRIKSDKIIAGEKIVSGYVYFEDDMIIAVTQEELPFDESIDRTGYYVSPGFIDTHTHGGAGNEFHDSAEAIIAGCNFHLNHGTTSICPTVSAAPLSVMERAVNAAKKAVKDPALQANIIGIHMEGPYLSKAQSGAQAPDFITPPIASEYEKLIANAEGIIVRWSYAPENDKDAAFCKHLVKNNILPSAAHTDAIYAEMLPAMEAGCRLITHLYSCTSTVTRDHGFRRLGVIETAYLHDDVYAEIIADGRHLPPDLIRLILKIKGTDKVILCTDSLDLAGTDAKSGTSLGGIDFIIEDNVCKLKDRSAFAGSIATSDRLIQVMTKEVGVKTETAVKMLTKNPAEILKLNKGVLEAGKDADILVFNEDVQMQDIFVMGKKVK